ncbi:MAG: hypothetical protein AAGA85_22035, partial [Bacteroidota bacterium]
MKNNLMGLTSFLSTLLALSTALECSGQSVPVGVEFLDPIRRESRRGDNWCTTWAADGHQYTSMCDGYGWDPDRQREIHTEVFRISGTFEEVQGHALPSYAVDFNEVDATNRYMPYYFGYGIVAIGDVLYQFLSRQNATNFMPPFQGINLIYSEDYGKTWYRFDGVEVTHTKLDYSGETQFFWQEQGVEREGKVGYAMSWIAVCQMGPGHTQGEQDGFVYLYAPNGSQVNELNLARVSVGSLLDRSTYEYFDTQSADGSVHWTDNIEERGVIHTFPASNKEGDPFGWYS